MPLQVEVGPSSFQKIKMLGRGDVGKVYLVREKKSGKLFAMKGELRTLRSGSPLFNWLHRSFVKERNDRAQENQACPNRARDSGHRKSSFHSHAPPLLPVRPVSLLLYGVLYGWRILPRATVKTWQVSF